MSQPFTLRTDAGDEEVDLWEFEARVRRGEVSPQSLVRFPAVTGEAFVTACELEVFRRLHEPHKAFFARSFNLGRFPWVTSAIILLNVGWHLYTVQGGPLDLDQMVLWGGKVGPLIFDLGEFWRLLAANFLHRDAVHVGLNMFVLFNVGGALENVYRPWDYLFLLLFSGLSTMTGSLFFSEAVTVGASGMVYGCLGGVVVFGLKYRSLLPGYYRKILGEAAIPTVLIFLWIGWTSVGVDNAAHLFGLVAGLAVTPFLTPRLLSRPAGRGALAPLRAAPAALVVLGVFAAQEYRKGSLPFFRVERDDEFGISLPVPRGWRRGTDSLGQMAFYNGLPGAGRATFAAEAVLLDEPGDAMQRARAFAEESLRPSALGAEVFWVISAPPKPAKLGDREAAVIHSTLDERSGTSRLVAYFVPRGDLVYQLVYSYPARFPRYGPILEDMAKRVRFDEPKALRQARARALLFPEAAWSLGELGQALRKLGDSGEASHALDLAVKKQPASVPLRAELALALLQAGRVDEACRAAEQAVVYGPRDPRALEVDARCEVARGNTQVALARVREARVVNPADERLRRAELALEAAVGRPP